MTAEKTRQQISSTIDLVADRWKSAGPLLPCFPLLAQGEPLPISRIAQAAGVEVRLIEEALRTARCRCDEDGCLIDLFGMSLQPTCHRLEINGRVVFSCCALWAHVIPKLVGHSANIESVDPASRQLVRLRVSPDGIESAEPANAMASLAVADSGSINANVEAAFCRHVRHLTSRQSAQRFAQASPSRRIVTLEGLHQAAMQLHQAIWARLGLSSQD